MCFMDNDSQSILLILLSRLEARFSQPTQPISRKMKKLTMNMGMSSEYFLVPFDFNG